MSTRFLLMTAWLAGCAGATTLPGTPPGEFELGVGDRALFQGYGLELRFEGVSADSRCPIDVTCVSAGDAAAVLRVVETGADPETVTLHSTMGDSETEAGGLRLTLIWVAPLPKEGVTIDPATYRIRLRADEP